MKEAHRLMVATHVEVVIDYEESGDSKSQRRNTLDGITKIDVNQESKVFRPSSPIIATIPKIEIFVRDTIPLGNQWQVSRCVNAMKKKKSEASLPKDGGNPCGMANKVGETQGSQKIMVISHEVKETNVGNATNGCHNLEASQVAMAEEDINSPYRLIDLS
ncbi:hypothetical protein ACFE04_025176 [Oxalis oulophora]